MSTRTKVFITGATGYIGGTVLSRLLAHPEFSSFEITALVRSADKAEKLQSLGLKTVLGSYSDFDVLTKAAYNADITITMANANELRVPAYGAMLKGLKQKFEETGNSHPLIHTSGTAFITDDAQGMHSDHIVYSDLDADAIEATPLDKFHRDIDTTLVAADKEGYVKVYFVTPGTIFGVATGKLVDLGVQHTLSMQIPAWIQIALARKRAGYIGLGKNVWPAVSVQDAADLYVKLFDAVRKTPEAIGHGRDGYYFVEAFEYSQMESITAIGKALAELGAIENAEPTALSEEERVAFLGPYWKAMSTNSRAKGERSRALGWAPVDGKDRFIASIKSEVAEVLKNVTPAQAAK